MCLHIIASSDREATVKTKCKTKNKATKSSAMEITALLVTGRPDLVAHAKVQRNWRVQHDHSTR